MEQIMRSETTILNLNRPLHMEMTAAHQHQLHARVLDDWGLHVLAAKMREEQAEEIGHSDLFIDRIMFLKGSPEIAFAKSPKRHGSLVEMFQADLADEEEAIVHDVTSARQAYEENDTGTGPLFGRIALDEEGHKAWLELQFDLIERIGELACTAKLVSFAPSGRGSSA